ncbi:MAG: hypothetical protein WAQ05_10540 [Rubrivivax sp.]
MRPFILPDPEAGIYFEAAAPDWRFALFFVFMALATAARRGRLPLTAPQLQSVLALLTMFYVWTFAIGNGRYFIAGLLLVGPLLVMAWRLLPGSRNLRALVLVAVTALQVLTMQLHYIANTWGLVQWRDGPGLAIEDSPLREQPAVFLTITGISYSLLVPRFHPHSRWANIAGQRDIRPGTREYPRLQALLRDPLPKYVVVPLNPAHMSPALQPTGPMLDLILDSLAVQGLAPDGQPCAVLRSTLPIGVLGEMTDAVPRQGFWFCPVQKSAATAARADQATAASQALRDVFERVEQRCPRFFPPGDGIEKHVEGLSLRHYPASDTRLYIDGEGRVQYKYFRALNPTMIGTVDAVRQNRFDIVCDKLPGRYQLPWRRD